MEARPMEEVTAGEAARVVREEMNVTMSLGDLGTSVEEERKPSQKRAPRRTGKGWSPQTLPSTQRRRLTTKVGV